MNNKLVIILLMLLAVVLPSSADTPEQLPATFDFGSYSIAAPAGMLSTVPAKNQYIASLPSGAYRMVAVISEGKPKNLGLLAADAVRSLKLDPKGLKELDADGLKGYTTSQRIDSKIITYALLRSGSEMVTLVITEPESLQPLGPIAVPTLKKR